jgi:hypothetical protein
VAPPHAGIKRL